MLQQKFKQDSIDRVANYNNQAKIKRREKAITKAAKKDSAITQLTINGNVIYQTINLKKDLDRK